MKEVVKIDDFTCSICLPKCWNILPVEWMATRDTWERKFLIFFVWPEGKTTQRKYITYLIKICS